MANARILRGLDLIGKRARIAPRPSPSPRASRTQATIIAAWFATANATGKNKAAAAIWQKNFVMGRSLGQDLRCAVSTKGS
jgi:hypothetical protein